MAIAWSRRANGAEPAPTDAIWALISNCSRDSGLGIRRRGFDKPPTSNPKSQIPNPCGVSEVVSNPDREARLAEFLRAADTGAAVRVQRVAGEHDVFPV